MKQMKKFFSAEPFWQNNGIALIRIIFGALLIYHGKEVFDSELMKGYAEWETFKNTPAKLMVYAGKGAEFVAGIFLFLGLFTRLGALIVIGTFLYITFFVGHGKFWYEDQHPFMFFLFGLLFIFTGPGAWSLDKSIFKR
jgi:putative oxidoreductase